MLASGQTRNSTTSSEPVERVKPRLFRKYQVQKSSALGLVIPQNLKLTVRLVDVADLDLGPAFMTSSMNWTQQFVKFPPSFELYIGSDARTGSLHGEESEPVAKVTTPWWNGVMATIANIEMLTAEEWPHYGHSLPSYVRKTWTVKREGWGRHYTVKGISNEGKPDLEPKILTWKGSKQVTKLLIDFNPNCNGNLKLLDSDGTLLAAWKQQRNPKVLGSIHIFEEARGVVPVEMIVVSCICVALVERINGVTWLSWVERRSQRRQ